MVLVANDLYFAIPSGETREADGSQHLDAQGMATASMDVTAQHSLSSGGTLDLSIQGSNDRAFWNTLFKVGSPTIPAEVSFSGSGTAPKTVSGVIAGYAYVRVRWVLNATAGDNAMLAVNLNLGL